MKRRVAVSMIALFSFLVIGSYSRGAGVQTKMASLAVERLGTCSGSVLSITRSATSNGCHAAMVKRGEGRYTVEVDGRAGPQYDAIVDNPKFSPDGRRIAYSAQKGDRQLVVVDDQVGPEYDEIGKASPILSPDGKRVWYTAQKGKKWLAVVDGQAGSEYGGISNPVFSADGTRVAYIVRNDEKYSVVVDGQAGLGYDGIGKDTLIFSADASLDSHA